MYQLKIDIRSNTRNENKVIPLPEGSAIFLGRENCEISLVHPLVSRRHFGFAVREGRLIAGDAGSRMGTQHNGKPLKSAYVKRGDQFVVGPFTIVILDFGKPSTGGASEPETPPAFVLPWSNGNANLINAFRNFYAAFFGAPKDAWVKFPSKMDGKQSAILLAKYIALSTALNLVNSILLSGANPVKLVSVGINQFILAILFWAIATAVTRFIVFPILKVQAGWSEILNYESICLALFLPIQIVSPVTFLLGLPALGILLMFAQVGYCAFGFSKTFRPDSKRFAILAGTLGLLLVMMGSTLFGVMHSVPRLEKGSRELTSTVEKLKAEFPDNYPSR